VTQKVKTSIEGEDNYGNQNDSSIEDNGDDVEGVLPAACLGGQTATAASAVVGQ
jgi:hypothetical protein